jgi:adiponectin receptor
MSLFALHNETRLSSFLHMFILTHSRVTAVNIHTHLIPFIMWSTSLIPFINSATFDADGPEVAFTAFALVCLFASVVYHTMAGCSHAAGLEFCSKVDYVGIGW